MGKPLLGQVLSANRTGTALSRRPRPWGVMPGIRRQRSRRLR
jgi:hypothetical protein